MSRRARITVPDLMFTLFSLAALGALYPVFHDHFQANLDVMGTGPEWLWQMVLPMALLVLMSVIYLKATQGVA